MDGDAGDCIVCQQPRAQGIHIFGQFLCAQCEQEIVHTDVTDARYAYYVECMKRIWAAALI